MCQALLRHTEAAANSSFSRRYLLLVFQPTISFTRLSADEWRTSPQLARVIASGIHGLTFKRDYW
jgi:hypothetical protein